jgi:hypothetical protein
MILPIPVDSRKWPLGQRMPAFSPRHCSSPRSTPRRAAQRRHDVTLIDHHDHAQANPTITNMTPIQLLGRPTRLRYAKCGTTNQGMAARLTHKLPTPVVTRAERPRSFEACAYLNSGSNWRSTARCCRGICSSRWRRVPPLKFEDAGESSRCPKYQGKHYEPRMDAETPTEPAGENGTSDDRCNKKGPDYDLRHPPTNAPLLERVRSTK